MAMTYKNYPDFVKHGLHAVPLGIAQPQMRLSAVLKLRRRLRRSEFVRVGTITSLCASTECKEQVRCSTYPNFCKPRVNDENFHLTFKHIFV